MFGRAVFEVTEVKGGRMVKEWNFDAEKNLNKCKKSNIELCVYVIWTFSYKK